MFKKISIAAVGLLLFIFMWYLWSPAVCLTPITYSLNRLDSEFLITDEDAEKAFAEAEKIWEDEIGYNLFIYKKDGSGKIKVDFVFDDRQSFTNASFVQKKFLDKQKEDIDFLNQSVSELTDKYNNLHKEYKRNLSKYNQELSAYNNEVRNYNDIGGAPQDVFLKLEGQRKNLQDQAEKLTSKADQLNLLSKNINQSNKKLNNIVKEYNLKVEEYNSKFGTHKEFTQGDYTDKRIHIYKFSSPYELSIVLAHEFGHALGLTHVDAKNSIMNYIFDENGNITKPSTADKEMFLQVCDSKFNLKILLHRLFNDTVFW